LAEVTTDSRLTDLNSTHMNHWRKCRWCPAKPDLVL